MKKKNYERMCNTMSINTADFAALAVTVVLFEVIY